jgi:hypothetical protein
LCRRILPRAALFGGKSGGKFPVLLLGMLAAALAALKGYEGDPLAREPRRDCMSRIKQIAVC